MKNKHPTENEKFKDAGELRQFGIALLKAYLPNFLSRLLLENKWDGKSDEFTKEYLPFIEAFGFVII